MKFCLLILSVTLLLGFAPVGAASWMLFDGTEFEAEVVEFDYDTKTVTFDSDGTPAPYNTRDLAFTSKRKLLFSKAFYQSYEDVDAKLMPAGKFWLFLATAISPVIFLIVGMWIAGIFFAKKFNPFKAVGAFIGSYLVGIAFLACYFIFSGKVGSGALIWVGAGVAAIAMTFFIASIYDANFVRGFLILVCHVIFAGIIAYLLIFSAEYFMPGDKLSSIWDEYIFTRVGLLDGPSRTGY